MPVHIPLQRTLALGALLLAAGSASEPGVRSPAISRCGHEVELLAAREALASGDREGAIRHLRAADARMERCQREGVPLEPAPAPDSVETGSWRGSRPARPHA